MLPSLGMAIHFATRNAGFSENYYADVTHGVGPECLAISPERLSVSALWVFGGMGFRMSPN